MKVVAWMLIFPGLVLPVSNVRDEIRGETFAAFVDGTGSSPSLPTHVSRAHSEDFFR